MATKKITHVDSGDTKVLAKALRKAIVFRDVMVDLETLGTTPGCSILSIGAVPFCLSAGALSDDSFYMPINTKSCVDAGLKTSASTLAWWEKQSEEARKVLTDAKKTKVKLKDALLDFNTWLSQFPDVRVWGNGADFDNPILVAAYEAVGLSQGWKPYNGRCYRTIKSVFDGPKLQRVGTFHNALDDARSQADHLINIYKAISANSHNKDLLKF